MSILCYHTVEPHWPSGLAMDPDVFSAHARWLARHRRVVDLGTAVRLMDARGRLPRGVVSLTFDDGLAGVYHHALPVLRDLGLPATVFVVARTLNGNRAVDWIDDAPDAPLDVLTPEQLLEMRACGFEVASHSFAHHRLPTLDPSECRQDLMQSRELLEDLLHEPVRHLAYPRGLHDAAVRDTAQKTGFAHAFSLPESTEEVGPYALPRVGIYRHNHTGTLRVKATRPYLRARLHPSTRLARAAVRVASRRGRPTPPPRQTNEPATSPAADSEAVAEPKAAVAYVMSRFPKVSETFILNEMLAIEQEGVEVRLHPLLRERASILHPGAAEMVARATYLPFVSPAIFGSQAWFLRRRPRAYLTTWFRTLVGTAGSLNFTVGAIGILPKVAHTARLLEQAGVRHVHAHFATHPALAGFAIHQLTGITYSFTAHGSDLHVDRHMLPQKVEAASFVVAVTEDNRGLIIQECGEDVRSKVHVVRCGVDTEVFRPPDSRAHSGPLRLLCVATIHEVKGQHILVEALSRLRELGVDVTLRLVGDGPDRRRIQRQIAAAGLAEVVEVLGAQPRDAVLRELEHADVLIAPSVPTSEGKREGLPVVLVEAMACGLPVIASRLSGIPEVVQHGANGLLVPPGDADALAEAIIRLDADPALRWRFGHNGRSTVLREFDLHDNARRLTSLFDQATFAAGGDAVNTR
jgi:colanic acid/amylovoran biosynthesis glycosyltransferase